MSTDEQDQILVKTVRQLQEKKTEQRCLAYKANGFATTLEDILARYHNGEHDANLVSLVETLPGNDEVLRTFRELGQVSVEIAALKAVLALD